MSDESSTRILLIVHAQRGSCASAEVLTSAGHAVFVESSIERAVEVFGRESPQLVVVDLELVENAGEWIRQLETHDSTHDFGVVVMASPGRPAWGLARSNKCVVGALPKSISPDVLVAFVKDALRKVPSRASLLAAAAAAVGNGGNHDANEPSGGGAPSREAKGAQRPAKGASLGKAFDSLFGEEEVVKPSKPVTSGTGTQWGGAANAAEVGPGELVCWSNVMGLDEVAQALRGISATGRLEIETARASMFLVIRRGRLASIVVDRVDLRSGEKGVFGGGGGFSIPAGIARGVTGSASERLHSEVAELEADQVEEVLISMGVDVLRRILDEKAGYQCRFRATEDVSSIILGVDLSIDIQGFLLRAHSMIDEFRGISKSHALGVSRFVRAEGVHPAEVQGVTSGQRRLLRVMQVPMPFLGLVNACSMNPMEVAFDILGLLENRLVESVSRS